jgi:hypothetical protein
MAFKEIVDSKTDNVCSKNTAYKGCGVAGEEAARSGNLKPTITELRKSQADGNELPKQSDSDSTDEGDETPTLPWTRS